MKYNNKLPYRERVRHAAYRDTYTKRSEEIQIRKEIKRMERDKEQANEPTISEKERGFAEKCELLRKLQEGIDEDEREY